MTQAQKTLLLWVLLIVMMVAIWSGGGASVAGPVMLPTFAVVFVVAWFLGRNGRKARVANEAGVRLLGLGRVAAAAERFAAASALSDLPVYRFNVAVAETQLFRFERALAELERAGKARQPDPLGAMIREQRTLVRALMGTATRAELDAFREKEAALTRLLVACSEVRSGRFAEASLILAEPVLKQLGGWLRALFDTLSAWCAFELQGERRPVDRAALFGEADPEGLLRHWPELRAFLDQAP